MINPAIPFPARYVAYVVVSDMGAPDGVHTFLNEAYIADATGLDESQIEDSIAFLKREGYFRPAKRRTEAQMGGVILDLPRLLGRSA